MGDEILKGLVTLIQKAETVLPDDVVKALQAAYDREEGIGKTQLSAILENVRIAKKSRRPMCQDTGIQTFFVKAGEDSPFLMHMEELITQAVQQATQVVPLRPNTMDPLSNVNHQDNTGDHVPYITVDVVDGEEIVVTAFPKGGGSENMSMLGMLKPGVGIEGAKDFIVDHVVSTGGQPCPPTVVGVGIGGGADLSLKLGKKSLLRPVGMRHPNKKIAALETELVERINAEGHGPMGLGGKTTVLDVHVELAHRHPASLPVGIVVQCWANRRAHMTIQKDGSWKVY